MFLFESKNKHESLSICIVKDPNSRRKSMIKQIKYCLVLLLLITVITVAHAQKANTVKKNNKQFDNAQQLFHQRNYTTALSVIDKLIEKQQMFPEVFLLKADVLHEINRIQEEAESLEQALAIDSVNYAKAFFLLGKARKSMGEYAKAKQAFQSFLNSGKYSPAQQTASYQYLHVCEFALKQLSNPVPFNPQPLGDSINTPSDEYWPSLSIDGKMLVFTRLVPFLDNITKRELKQEDFFQSEYSNHAWSKSQPLKSLNTMNNEGAQCLSPNAKWLFFTACSQRDSWGSCDLYYSSANGSSWNVPQNAGQPVNSAMWEAQPSLSANNDFLYFVSNRKGGKGGMDIWRCPLISIENGQIRWGKAENLGDSINTPGNEMSPFIHPDGKTLYFASDYWPGMGGTDLFITTMKADSGWTSPRNLGFPINTRFDEKGLIVDAKGQRAIFSTNRDNNNLDLFEFELPEKLRPLPVTYAQGTVFDQENGQFLQASVELVKLDSNEKSFTLKTDQDGKFLFGLPLKHRYMMNVTVPGYVFYSRHFALDSLQTAIEPFLFDIPMQAIRKDARVILQNVFFETNSFILLPESEKELNKLVLFLQNNPSVKIEIGGHTDRIGTASYNNQLSEKRAESVYQYLVEKGISASRLQFKGYGFEMPVSSNETKEGRANNRRTEFRIID